MKVILIQDVKSLGKKGDIVDINDGYARNYVLPKKLGLEANNKNLNDLKLQKQNEVKVAKEKLEEAKAFAEELKDKSVTLHIKCGEGGRLFGSISTKEIAKAITDQLGYDIDKKKMMLDEQIKTLGTHIIKIKLHKDVIGELAVKVLEAK